MNRTFLAGICCALLFAAGAANAEQDRKAPTKVLTDTQMDRVTAGDASALAFGQFTSTFTSFSMVDGGFQSFSSSSSSSFSQ